MQPKLRFIDNRQSGFFITVKQRVDDYFKERNLSKHANGLMYFKSAFYIGGLFTFYGLIISNQFTPLTMLLMAIFLGVFAA
ncbi:MAG TPA: acyl-CoA desaturase, partial [Cytophagaceae bacterium]